MCKLFDTLPGIGVDSTTSGNFLFANKMSTICPYAARTFVLVNLDEHL